MFHHNFQIKTSCPQPLQSSLFSYRINEFLYTNLINEAQEKGFEIISFGTATLEHGKVLNRNLAQYKEGYGTSTYINYRYEKEY